VMTRCMVVTVSHGAPKVITGRGKAKVRPGVLPPLGGAPLGATLSW
jgi:hypothetical protein